MTTGPWELDRPVRLGEYIVLDQLGRGGMGIVYLAEAPDGSQVAIKVIRHRLDGDPHAMMQFRREVEAARRVPRHCTAPVIDAALDHDPPYIVTEYIKGKTLEEAVAEEPLSPSDLHGVALGIVEALIEIHRVGVVHGDLTPRNVLLSRSRPRVIDFGIARVPAQTSGSSGSRFMGTPPFMAPEHFDDRPVREAADIFAWGSVIAFAGTGRKPFGNGSPIELGRRISAQQPDLDGLDPVLREIVEAAMRKQPADRPSAAVLRERLMRAARTADAAEKRAVVVQEVLRTAEQESDAPLFTTTHGWRDGSGLRGVPLVLVVASALVALVMFTLMVWFQRPGRFGGWVHWGMRTLFGYGAFVVPIIISVWLVSFFRRPSVPSLLLLARAVLRDRRPQVMWRALTSALVTTSRSVWLGPAAVLGCSLGIVHVLRESPPLDAGWELQAHRGLSWDQGNTGHDHTGW